MAERWDVRESTAVSTLQVGVFSDALSAQAALRGMQIGVRDIRLAASKDALQTATNRMEELAKCAHGFVDPLAQKSLYPENKARFAKVGGLIDQYAAGAKEVAGLQAGILDVRDKLGTVAPQLSQLQEQQKRIVAERTLPIAAQAEEALEGAIVVARQRTAHGTSGNRPRSHGQEPKDHGVALPAPSTTSRSCWLKKPGSRRKRRSSRTSAPKPSARLP